MSETPETALPVGPATRVFLNFALRLEGGEEIDSNFGADAVSFAVGDGSLLPGFERCLMGLRAGVRQQFRVPPEDAFGQPNDNNLQRVDRDHFDPSFDLSPGLVVSFRDAAGGEVPGVVVEVDESEVTVDFNHPLAGRTILFEVEIHRVEAAELH